MALKKLKSAETYSDIDDVFTDIKSRHNRAKVIFTDDEISNNQDNANITNKRKIKPIPVLPKVPSTLSEEFNLPVVSDTDTKQKVKAVKKTPVYCNSTIATSLLENWNVEEKNRHSLNVSTVCEIPEKRNKLFLSENHYKYYSEKENEYPIVMKQSVSSNRSSCTKHINTSSLRRQANNAQKCDKQLSLKINVDTNTNNTFNDDGNITQDKIVSHREQINSISSHSASTNDEKLLYLIGTYILFYINDS